MGGAARCGWKGVRVSLTRLHFDILTLAPVQVLPGLCFAPIGLVNMLNSGGAVTAMQCTATAAPAAHACSTCTCCDTWSTSQRHTRHSHAPQPTSTHNKTEVHGTAAAVRGAQGLGPSGRRVRVSVSLQVKGGGELVAYACKAPHAAMADGTAVDVHYDAVSRRLAMDVAFTSHGRTIDLVWFVHGE
ncbi:unnamed protein product [Closterium sp. Yama58-4]|nr:unnamed protein product [Closterium sp. Yama58-4]